MPPLPFVQIKGKYITANTPQELIKDEAKAKTTKKTNKIKFSALISSACNNIEKPKEIKLVTAQIIRMTGRKCRLSLILNTT